MKIKRIKIEKLTEATLIKNKAIEGYASGKTMFLWKEAPESVSGLSREQMQIMEPFTVLNYERDREGLINALIFLLRKNGDIKVWFPENENHIGYLFNFKKSITLKELSEELDILYT